MAAGGMMVFVCGIVLVIGLGVLLIAGWMIAAYNGFVAARNNADNAWAQIDVTLKRRYDLIPNLVETVRGYARHESETLEKVIQARNAAASAQGPAQAAAAEGLLMGAMRQLFAVAEAYPDLKANTNFLELQRELAGTENTIGSARNAYNSIATGYNTKLQVFPGNLIAGMFNFRPRDLFNVTAAEEREAPKVKF